MNQEVHAAVDRLLLEQGEYQPLEYLLQEGRLLYTDYEAWRGGELDYLGEALFGDPAQVRGQLADAERYLQRRGWQAATLRYTPWHTGTAEQPSRALRFSDDDALNQSFHRRYHRPQDRPQLDLFTDSPATSLVNGIVEALSNRNPVTARRQLERLGDTAPDHPRFGELERLTEAAEALATPVADARAELHYLQRILAPLAESLLGPADHELTIPLWRRLSAALADQAYLPGEPELHLSHTAAMSRDWAAVREAVQREPGWRDHPVLLQRHARSCEHRRERAAALGSWFRLCWHFPKEADALETSSDGELRELWDAFAELDPELPIRLFPAWLLLRLPGLVALLGGSGPELDGTAGSCPESFQTLQKLLRKRARIAPGERAGDMALRARLQEEEPLLFARFLSSISAE